MCKIFGFSGDLNGECIKIIRGLILAEEGNNPHGTGLVLYDEKKGQFMIKKKGLRGLYFIARGYGDFLNRNRDSKTHLIGHVRLKTSGPQTDRNAHPFGSVCRGRWHFLIHNGVLGGRMLKVAQKFSANTDKVEVDSELFLRCITAQLRKGVKITDAIKNATYEISDIGDFAFALLNDEGIYLWRNSQRPLNVFFYGDNIFFASTKNMFEKALEIAGVEPDQIEYSEVKPYHLYRIRFKDGKPVIKDTDEIPHRDTVSKKKKKSYSFYDEYGYYDLYGYGNGKNKKQKEQSPLFNPCWGNTGGLEDKCTTEDEIFNKAPYELTNEELDRAISILEQDYYTVSDSDVETKIDIEACLQAYYDERRNRQIFKGGGNEVEPF
ncbi:class II glutamine amidotransferase [Thermodesulfovibrio thiophilus]|uniref:class II glutamine amidotransferase n=1 Tax=Thermodesulfovibrio thiophilus TaxID=340095 RepID=UPI00042226D4|nr:class II glutamine amidotransferase [Thermodesulfovibrio thiophilus]